MRRPLSLASRLALAFGGLFLAVSAASAALAFWRAGEAAERAYHERMEKLARGLSGAGFAVNRDILVKMKSVVGVDVASYDPERNELISSLSSADHFELVYVLTADKSPYISETPEAYVPGPVAKDLPRASAGPRLRFQIFGAWQTEGGRRKLVLLLVPQEEIDRVRSAAVTPALLAALLGAGAVVLLAWMLAAGVARPVRRLAAEAGRAAEGGLEFRHVSGGGREIEELSESLERMTAALARSRAELVKSERAAAAGQMAAALAHEVRNPLTGAKMTVEMLLAEERDESRREELRSVREELGRLELVVDELVSFARPAPPVFARVKLAEVAHEVLEFMRRQLEHAHVKAEVVEAQSAPAARADRNKIKQVLVNLVLNAMQAQARGGRVSVRVEPAGEGRVSVEVADSGPGVGAAELEKIFAPFYTTKQSGAGLGLAVSRGIAEEHGGSLVCRTAEGGGAVFRLELEAWKE